MKNLEKLSIVILIVLCWKYGIALEVSTYEKKFRTLEKSLQYFVQGTLFITDDDNYPYAVCETTKTNLEKICNVTLISSTRDYRTCTDIKIYSGPGNTLFLGGYFQVLPYNNDHVLLAWWDKSISGQDQTTEMELSYKLGIINMLNCTTAYLDFSIDKVAYSFFPAIVPYANRFEVIINSKGKCMHSERCMITYDLEGNQLGSIKKYQPEISQYANPVFKNFPENGYFMSVQNLHNITVLFVNTYGEEKLLSQDIINPQVQRHLTSFSSRHGLYTICRVIILKLDFSSIRCYQFDSETRLRINETVTVPLGVGWLTTRSIAYGGILLAIPGCGKKKWDMGICRQFHVFKIYENGRSDGPHEVDAPEIDCYDTGVDLQVHITEDSKKKEYCFDFSCLPTNSSLTYISKCVSQKMLIT